MPRRKIAFIHPDLGIGGAERLVLDVANALSSQQNEIYFLTNHFDKNHAFEELKSGKIRVDVFGDWLPRSIFGRFQALCAYFRMIYLTFIYALFFKRDDKPDIFFVDLIPIAIPILKLWGEKVIYYCHHPDLLASAPGGTLKSLYRKPINWMEMKSTGQADVLLVNSEYTASVFRVTFPEIQKPIQIIYPNVAYSYLESVRKVKNPKPIRDIVPQIPDDSTNIFLSINRFHPAKKLDLAILAMEALRQNITSEAWKGIFLIIAGGYDLRSTINAEYYHELEKITKEKNLQDKIIFLKSPSDSQKTDLLLACDCLIYTPVKEHFGIVPLEAMTVSKPVIACDSGGPRETVDHGLTGFLCEPNPNSMAEYMKQILNKKLAKEMGIKGEKALQNKFSQESFAKNLKAVVDNINKIYA